MGREEKKTKYMGIEHRLSGRRCLATMISSSVVFVCVLIGVTMNLTTLYDVNFDHMGLRTFCMFTVNSNLLCALGMIMTVPYTVDGMVKKRFHLPNWLVCLLFAGVTSVALTFLISLCVLSPVKGFVLIFTGSRFFLHGLCPILAIAAFCFFIYSHVITFRESVYALIPVMLYAMVYYFMVEILGPDNGGWDDFYGFFTHIPSWVSLISFMPLTFIIASVVRLLHNKSCKVFKNHAEKLYEQEFTGVNPRDQIIDIAGNHVIADNHAIDIPLWLLNIVVKHSNGKMDVETACNVYMDTVLKKIRSNPS